MSLFPYRSVLWHCCKLLPWRSTDQSWSVQTWENLSWTCKDKRTSQTWKGGKSLLFQYMNSGVISGLWKTQADEKQVLWDSTCLAYILILTLMCHDQVFVSSKRVLGIFPFGGFSSMTDQSTFRTAPSANLLPWMAGTQAPWHSGSITPGRAAPTITSLTSTLKTSLWVILLRKPFPVGLEIGLWATRV